MNAVKARRVATLLIAGLVCSLGAPLLRAQTLGDLAKKEEERRKTIAKPAKVITNKDLSPGPTSATPPPPAAAGGGDAKAAGAADTPTKVEADDKDKGEKKDQAYWTGKLKGLQQQLERDQSFADALQVKINALTTDFVNRDDPAQRAKIEAERNKSLAELARLKKSVVDDTKAIADLQEEARRAGVPPGWLR